MSDDPRPSPSRSLTALALVSTPLLLFVSPTLRLYAGNREDLYYQISVVTPFIWLALLVGVIGAASWALSRIAPFRLVTWAYLLFAPFLLSYRFLGDASSALPPLLGLAVSWSIESAPGLALWCVA